MRITTTTEFVISTVNAVGALLRDTELAGAALNRRVAAFKMRQLFTKLTPIAQAASTDLNNLLDDHMVKGEDGNPVQAGADGTVQLKNGREYKLSEMALLNTEQVVDVEPLTVEDLEACGVPYSGATILALGPFLQEPLDAVIAPLDSAE